MKTGALCGNTVITVRSIYAGGPAEVLAAYKQAATVISIEKLASMLSDMDFVYPYHQAVGFYLEASQSYSVTEIGVFENIPKEFDFYLDYNMEKTEYSRRWKLNYPIDS
jgi:hypothetical protein